ncbi:scopoletin glucosyltransferase-like [Henckelia pumila]|uniref:scopoletin glucosyltransferase-like n=1 Tax=Henckelia pumila TaxID=405737 RepID=UPI003C6E7D27
MSKLHLFFLPFMAHGHMIPMLDMAKLFTSRGVKTTMISTLAFSDPIKKAQESGIDIGLIIITLPNQESGLPEYIQRLDQVTTVDFVRKFVKAISLLQEPVERLIKQHSPDCLVSDTFFPWTTDSAAKFGIPRLVFHGTGYLARCASEQMRLHKPFKNVSSDSETFTLPCLPHQLKFTRTQISPFDLRRRSEGEFAELIFRSREADRRSYGVVVNSFYELESGYADHYKNFLGIKAWNIGPFLLCKDGDKEKGRRGRESAIDEHECLAWLDSKKPYSVVYACFGSMASCTQVQLHEIALGLESSGQDFIWVVRDIDIDDFFMPNGFEERMRSSEKGLIIRGWAPQMLILDHPSIGAFVTHCGWNSILEGVCAGVPMVTWPMFAEQFFNEKLVTEVLRVGVSVGNKRWRTVAIEGVGREAVSEAVRRVMAAPEMRDRAMCYREMARKAVDEGGSSYNDLSALIQELSTLSIGSSYCE